MHDIDKAMFEAEAETGFETYGETYGELSGETYGETYGESEYEFQQSGEFEGSQELALASELLEVTSEAELDRFLGKLLSGVVAAGRDFARSDAGRAVGGILKSAAKRALPQVGQALGNVLAPGTGGAIGQKAGSWLSGRLELGLQTEGLSAEDREYETARAFVRFANETAQRAARSTGAAPPAVAAQRAAVAAAQQHLPGLLRVAASSTAGPKGQATHGRWVRQGNHIVVLDA